MIELTRWDTRAVIYRSESATELAYALIEAVRAGTDLSRAHLSRASLDGAHLDGAHLSRASLDGAHLVGASLVGAHLVGANLFGANLSRAHLSRAHLVGAHLVGASLVGANLVGASLVGANLVGANLVGANLVGANLDPIRADVRAILEVAPADVPALRNALVAGHFDGSHYTGECACLVGTIAKARGCDLESIPGLKPDSERPAERWALAISAGDTPDTNPVAAITLGWIDEWLAEHPSASVTP